MGQGIYSLLILIDSGYGDIYDFSAVQFNLINSVNEMLGHIFSYNLEKFYNIRITTGVHTNGKY